MNGPPRKLQSWDAPETEGLKVRWTASGGTIFDGRMIALKDDPIWAAISDFKLPYPPFVKGSNARVADVDRKEAMAFGLIDRDRAVDLK